MGDPANGETLSTAPLSASNVLELLKFYNGEAIDFGGVRVIMTMLSDSARAARLRAVCISGAKLWRKE